MNDEVIFDKKFNRNLVKYITARIDFFLYKNNTITNKIQINNYSDKNIKIYNPSWLNTEKGQGTVLESYKGYLELEITSPITAELNLQFKSSDFRDKNNRRFPLYIDYTLLIIDGNVKFNSNHTVWHDNALEYKQNVKKDEKVFIYIEWQPFTNKSTYN